MLGVIRRDSQRARVPASDIALVCSGRGRSRRVYDRHVSQGRGEAVARGRLALAVLLAAAVALVEPSLLTTPSTAVLAAVAAATVAAVIGLHRPLMTVMSGLHGLPARNADEAPSFLAERVTDAARHPLRPRAPGLV